MNLSELTIHRAHHSLLKKEISAVELAKSFFEHIKNSEKTIKAYLKLTPDSALDSAKQVDDWISQGKEIHPLAGIPIAIKDNILVKGFQATAASKILENYTASYDATVVKKLKAVGALIIGKTNLDEFAMGASTENSAFQLTHNPHDNSKVPGGSSGGSAAAVAAFEAIGALGSDTGGSVRQPASFCGVVGLRPTYGAVSRFGLIAMASSLDQIGPLARNTEDAAILFETISGNDNFDSTSYPGEQDFFRPSKQEDLRGLKIGLPKEYFIEGLDGGVAKVIEQAAENFKKLGAEIKQVSLPHTKYSLSAYYVIVPSEVSANLARFDGIRYGLSIHQGNDLMEVYLNSREQGLGAEPKRRVMLGTFALSAGYYDAYYKKAQKVRAKIKEDFERVFKEVDILLSPTAPTTAFKLGEKSQDPLSMYLADVFTAPQPLAGIPAISVPAGNANGLPVGMQLMGPHFSEALLFKAAYAFEKFTV
ncbi:Asp-tRNA(Asn)/Glu-tRNA(Gln) amidotransferase subunit GatA [Candidatus Parcubacteria bacterium]|nr:MAG: Asp-tRNA(Asn)/Glu-tRNA(Gln) amidotransferase subunit GatA [Candidatus Parcubacteria bacterium]